MTLYSISVSIQRLVKNLCKFFKFTQRFFHVSRICDVYGISTLTQKEDVFFPVFFFVCDNEIRPKFSDAININGFCATYFSQKTSLCLWMTAKLGYSNEFFLCSQVYNTLCCAWNKRYNSLIGVFDRYGVLCGIYELLHKGMSRNVGKSCTVLSHTRLMQTLKTTVFTF